MNTTFKRAYFYFVIAISFLISGCSDSLSGEGPIYFTTAFQCEHKFSESGWCFSTPSRIFSSDYKFVGQGSVQDYIVENGKVCVSNTEGCIKINVEIADRK
ncbi:hypothetical protein ACMXYO_05675 [Neptuniibacter sp. QD37_6]|uniref:hypothetical protein n=1 Tax=Neptuniibacter sp. QD37_6 TaxID=3398210 RepID=UPI0039F4D72F